MYNDRNFIILIMGEDNVRQLHKECTHFIYISTQHFVCIHVYSLHVVIN
jgi:hypothetical protein